MKKMKRKIRYKNYTKKLITCWCFIVVFRAHTHKELSRFTLERERENREILPLVLFFLSSLSERERERERERESVIRA